MQQTPDQSYRTLERTAPALSNGFPYWANLYALHDTPKRLYPWHWHTEIELFQIVEGQINYYVPTGLRHAKTGDVGFINSGTLHMTRCPKGLKGVAQEHIFLPALIGTGSNTDIESKYLDPILQSPLDMLLLPAGCEQAQKIQPILHQAYQLCQQKPFGFELRIRSLISEIWLLLLQYIESIHLAAPKVHDIDAVRIKAMLNYVRDHYAEKITLSDIAQAAHIGSRECSRCFHRQLQMTPIEYLIEYRIGKACTLLHQTDLSITEIAAQCGFVSGSYFTKTFREKMRRTPKEYRAQLK